MGRHFSSNYKNRKNLPWILQQTKRPPNQGADRYCTDASGFLAVTEPGWLTGTMPCQRATRDFVRDCLLPYSQLTPISGGRSPIRNLGTRWMGVVFTTPQWSLRVTKQLFFPLISILSNIEWSLIISFSSLFIVFFVLLFDFLYDVVMEYFVIVFLRYHVHIGRFVCRDVDFIRFFNCFYVSF